MPRARLLDEPGADRDREDHYRYREREESLTHRDPRTSPGEHYPTHNNRTRTPRRVHHSATPHIDRYRIPLDSRGAAVQILANVPETSKLLRRDLPFQELPERGR